MASIFGGMGSYRPIGVGQMPSSPYSLMLKPAAPAPSPSMFGGIGKRLGGIFGGGGKRNWGDILQTVGAGLQQMDGGTELTDYLANREDSQMRRDLFGMRTQQHKMETAEAQSEQATATERQRMVNEYISTLPVEQQQQALLQYTIDPEGFAERFLGSAGDGSWQHGQGYSHLWRPNPDGTVTLGDPLPLSRRSLYQMPLDDGYDYPGE